ncbi:MAG: hypothetical protein K0Q94_4584 [Paenibacillus sp.]|jgi:hypothetical protein|nr:hypothetical protein [Paenibacillus sp.]
MAVSKPRKDSRPQPGPQRYSRDINVYLPPSPVLSYKQQQVETGRFAYTRKGPKQK